MTEYNQNQHESRICSVLVSVANIHKEPEYKTEIITQTLLGEQLKIFERNESWLRVSQWDGYEGWINSSAVTEKETPMGTSHTVADLFNGVYAEKSKSSPILRDLVFGNALVILDNVDDWSRVILPDSQLGKRLVHKYPNPVKNIPRYIIDQPVQAIASPIKSDSALSSALFIASETSPIIKPTTINSNPESMYV